MFARLNLIIIPLIAVTVGCAGSADPRVRIALDQMTAELTAVEDRYYDLEYKYQQAQEELAACKTGGMLNEACPPGVSSAGVLSTGVSSPIIQSGTPLDSSEVILPNIDMGIPADYQLQAGEFEIGPVTHLALQPRETGGVDLNDDRIDDAIALRLLPQDSNGTVVNEPGSVTISLLDPAEAGESQRVGLWRFDSDEIAELLASASRDGIGMELPWQSDAPQHNELMLYVRYEGESGKRFETSMDIRVNITDSIVRNAAEDVSRFIAQLDSQPAVLQATAALPFSNDKPVNTFVPVEEHGDPDPDADVEWKPVR